MEEWVNLDPEGFPDYSVSNFGRVRHEGHRCHILTQSHNQSGLHKIGMMCPSVGTQVTRSVAPLVALAFLPDPMNERFNTPINVDGDRGNNRADNLMWRPRWFAVKYHQQFFNNRRGFDVPIMDIDSGEIFETSWVAALRYGLIDREIAVATLNRTYVFPTGQEFRVIRD